MNDNTIPSGQPVDDSNHIAIIGIAGRYPKSPNIEEFWNNLKNGVDCLEGVTDEELDELGIPSHVYSDPSFVRRGTRLPGADCFDARFFGFTPREAQAMDPQSRIFLETCYESIENAGYNPFSIEGHVGVFAGSNPNDYASLVGVADPSDSLGAFDQLIGSDKDFLATRVAHKLNLKGPALNLQTACSTSLVAVHMAVQSLLNYESSACLAGGVTVNFRQGVGYIYQDGMILAPDGKCRAFDENAAGTTLGQGCGVVFLKRMEDAVADNDHIYAIIRGSAINNDGSDKISFTAPSENGQAEVVALAHQLADIESDTIDYVEAHGTGTKLGDPIEIAGLTRAFAPGTNRTGYCAIGSVKTNLGHTDAAAGITGLLKTVLSLHNKKIVPSLHFSKPNSVIEFETTPFYVNFILQDWERSDSPRRAGVSAFGIGGTNAHVVLEEAAARNVTTTENGLPLILPLSAKTKVALEQKILDLQAYIDSHPTSELGNIAYTLRHGRPEFKHRTALVTSNENGEKLLDNLTVSGKSLGEDKKIVWMFSGQGSQYVGMCAGLYKSSNEFASAVDECARLFLPLLGLDLKDLVFIDESDKATNVLRQTNYTQPVLFTVEYALSRFLHSLGLVPDSVVGHSIGEFAAAVEAGILTLHDAVKVVFARAKLMQAMEPGAMLSVPLSAEELSVVLPDTLEIAAENALNLSVVSGHELAIELFCEQLEKKGVTTQRIQTSHAFHSVMMEKAAVEFEKVMNDVTLNKPVIPMTSNVTGRWLTDQEAVNPAFWASQITSTVRFADCISTASEAGESVYLELGPGNTLSTLVKRNASIDAKTTGVASLVRHPSTQGDDYCHALLSLGKLWCSGMELDWKTMEEGTDYCRIPLPTYPFERERHWAPSRKHVLALPHFGELSDSYETSLQRKPIDQWLYVPSWKRVADLSVEERQASSIVRVFLCPNKDSFPEVVKDLQLTGEKVFVYPVDCYQSVEPGKIYTVNPSNDEDIERVFNELIELGKPVTHIIHAWLSGKVGSVQGGLDDLLNYGVHSAHNCARIASKFSGDRPVQLDFLTSGAHLVTGSETVIPEAAALLGPAKVIPLEYPGISCRHIDLESGFNSSSDSYQLRKILESNGDDKTLAIRGKYLWEYRVEELSVTQGRNPTLRENGNYLIVGGTGGVGLSIARFLVDNYNAKIALTGRTGRPIRSDETGSESNLRLDLLESIERDAAGFLVLAVDTTDEESMRAVVEQVQESFGDINGVIVAAGVADQAGAIHRRTRNQAIEAISSKVHGSEILFNIFKDRHLDFLFFSSSIASMLYHNRFGQVGYVTANSFVEAFAFKARENGIPAVTVAWDDWMNIGMSVRAAADFSQTYGTNVKLVDEMHSFTPEDGVELFRLSLSSGEPLLYVSTTDLNARMEQDVNVVSPFLEQAVGTDESVATIDHDGSVQSVVEKIWSELLGFERFEESDDFFDLGGDSLQAARMADKLGRTLKLEIPLNTIFDRSSLKALTTELESMASQNSKSIERKALVGSVPLGPAQLRFLARNNPNPNHFNISVMLSGATTIDAAKLEQALGFLICHHDSLRFRLQEIDNGAYSQESVSESDSDFKLDHFVDVDPEENSIERISNEIQHGLDLRNGPVFRAALIETTVEEQFLLLVVHHMVSDRISLFLLLDGLNQIYPQLLEGKAPTLTARTVSYQDWVNEQHKLASLDDDLIRIKLDQNWNMVAKLPQMTRSTLASNTNKSAKALAVKISSEIASKVLKNKNGRSDELILLAIGSAVAEWSKAEAALIETLSHGRRNLPELDVSRTTGFFLSYNPVLIDCSEVKSPKERVDVLRLAMDRAWMVDVLKENHDNAEVRQWIKKIPKSEVLFNFVGRQIAAEEDAFFTLVDKKRGDETDQEGYRDHLLAIRAEVLDEKSIELTIVYSEVFHNRVMIEEFTDRIQKHLFDLVSS